MTLSNLWDELEYIASEIACLSHQLFRPRCSNAAELDGRLEDLRKKQSEAAAVVRKIREAERDAPLATCISMRERNIPEMDVYC